MISGDISWSQVIWENAGWSHLISGDLPGILNCTAKICAYFRWFQKILSSGDVKSCQGSIIKYQMIWRDLSWTEVFLGDLRWSQLISSDLRQCRVIPADLRLSQVFWIALQKSEDIFFDFRRSEVTSKLRWSPIMSGGISLNIRWSELISVELR